MSSITDMFVKKEELPFVVKEEGRVGNIYYLVAEDKENLYFYDDRKFVINKFGNIQRFMEYFPKFGKFEIERFLAERTMASLVVTRDLTDIMNMTVMCEGVIFDKEDISKRLFDHFFEVKKRKGYDSWLAINIRR